MFFRNPSDMQIETLRNNVLELKDSKEQIEKLQKLNDWEFTRLVSFPENEKQFKNLFLIIAKDETLITRYSKAMEIFVRFSESYNAGGFVWGTTVRPPQGTKRYSGGPVWNNAPASDANTLEQKPDLSPKSNL